ncbi:MAG: dodecin domain-containing protein [Desulfuromonas sp.]|uniref:dodecin domain-containing protein n=1 Tax=Desulfuromonas sp. TaxID=892 RepID=UPI000CB0B1D5|nr:dodecin domain-containing protein [Desulfuromonas sp.]PLX86683.1 MAG: dodecin domain-containing protein [Desulfuromonas sp.]
MSVAKVIEIHSEGKSIEAAAEAALIETARSVDGIMNLYLQDIQAIVEDNRIIKYRLNAKVTFLVQS